MKALLRCHGARICGFELSQPRPVSIIMGMTVAVEKPTREFEVGTLGWTADDLDDPRIERLWEKGRYEIVEGVLTAMPPAQLDNAPPLFRLLYVIQKHLDDRSLGGMMGMEVDVIVGKRRVAIVDAIYLTDADKRRQAQLYARKSKRKPRVRFGRVMIAPTLIIESISAGHEAHDRDTKFRWYAEAGVPNYWILDPLRRSLQCFALGKAGYRAVAAGSGNAKLKLPLFPGLTISLSELWIA
jgi:Uma2 family endonuclease